MVRTATSVLMVALAISVIASLGCSSAIASPSPGPRPLKVQVPTPRLIAAAGHQRLISVVAETTPSATCRALVRVKQATTKLMPLVADAQGRVGWRWLILPTSPSGSWRIDVSCRSGALHGSGSTSVLVVTGSKVRKGPIGDPTSLRAASGKPAGMGGGVCGPFEPGQCTCLAYQKRPDVYDTAVAHGVPAGGTRAAGSQFYVWDGEQWLVNAQRAGIPTGSQPVAGALVVWGVPNSAAYGHVAYVEAATSPTHVLVSECNYDFEGHCRTIWENPQAAPNLQGYIYGGPAGSGPGSTQGGGSPSPTEAPPTPQLNGGWETAFQAPGHELWVVGTADDPGSLHLGMEPGTSPSITALANGGWEAAFQAPGHELWVVGSDDRGAMHLGVEPGTSPSIVGLPGGGWEAAFQAPGHELWVVGTADDPGSLHLGMEPGTSPSVTG